MRTEQSPVLAGSSKPGSNETTTPRVDSSSTPRKWQRILAALVSGKTLNRFEAAKELRDWCLNTTISQLERRGLTIYRREETVPGAFGPVHCCRYWLAPQSVALACELLGLNGNDHEEA